MAAKLPQAKRDEQFPLLLVAGAGDVGDVPRPNSFTAFLNFPRSQSSTNGKRSLTDRFPEYISTCWMTLTLLGVSFLIFYAIGMVAFKSQASIIVLRCENDSKPTRNLFYHHIIPRGGMVPFVIYSEYLGTIAVRYPNIQIYVNFLIDDSNKLTLAEYRRSKYDRLYTKHKFNLYEDFNNKEILKFQNRYPNVNITLEPLSKYMAKTPLKFWRDIPTDYLNIYTGLYSVWKYGGTALELASAYSQYMTRNFNPVKAEILRLQNDAVPPKGFDDILTKLEEDENMFKMIYSLLSSILHNTRHVMDSIMLSEKLLNGTNDKNITRASIIFDNFNTAERLNSIKGANQNSKSSTDGEYNLTTNKAEDTTILDTMIEELSNPLNIILKNNQSGNSTDQDNKSEYRVILNEGNAKTTSSPLSTFTITVNGVSTNSTKEPGMIALKVWKENQSALTKNSNSSTDTPRSNLSSETPHFVLFYDIIISEKVLKPNIKKDKNETSKSDHFMMRKAAVTKPDSRIFLSQDGSFVSATSRLHPLLTHVLEVASRLVYPKKAIQEALFAHCNFIYEKMYCNGIRLID